MAHGGKRRGAGRKPGSLTKKTQLLAEAATAAGITPLDFMLAIVRDVTADRRERAAMAVAAAPYVHPRLAATVLKAEVDSDGPMVVVINRFADGSGQITAGPAGPNHPRVIEHE